MEILKNPLIKGCIAFFISISLLALTKDVNDSFGHFDGIAIVITVFTLYPAYIAIIMAKYDAGVLPFKNHRVRFIVRGIVLAALAVGAFSFTTKALAYFFYSVSIFWPVFNISFNKYADFSFWYVGHTASIDKTINYINNRLHFVKIYPFWLMATYTLFIYIGVKLITIFYI